MQEGQCLWCLSRLFFVPLPGEVFTMCRAHGETVEQIDVKSGFSPAIKRHLMEGVPCNKFGAGQSPCEPLKEEPFNIPPVRREGERWLLANHFSF
jgi:hypothetical protein